MAASAIHRIHEWNRARKWELFTERCLRSPNDRVLDIGFGAQNDPSGYENTIEHRLPDLTRLTGLTIQEIPDENPFPGMHIVRYDGTVFPFAAGEFDVGWSNAVIEHVGSDEAKVEFLRETNRVCERAFVTTPNRWFPLEPHTKLPLLHYLPKRVFDALLPKLGKAWARGDYMDLLSERRFRTLLDRAGITDYTIHKNRLGPLTVDFVAVF